MNNKNIQYAALTIDISGDNKYKKGKILLNNINAITDNHRDNRLDCELNHHGYPIQVNIETIFRVFL